MQYLTCETQNMAAFNTGVKVGSLKWQPTQAKTMSAAKAVAQRNRTFQNTVAHVAFVTADCKIVPLAHRICGVWTDAAES